MVVGPRDSQDDRPTAPLTYSHNAESSGDSVEPLGYVTDRVDERRCVFLEMLANGLVVNVLEIDSAAAS
jgi:hypothetical protein